MTPLVALDLKRITAEVAARHGMLLRPDDPAMLLVTMNEVVLQQVIGSIETRAEEIYAAGRIPGCSRMAECSPAKPAWAVGGSLWPDAQGVVGCVAPCWSAPEVPVSWPEPF